MSFFFGQPFRKKKIVIIIITHNSIPSKILKHWSESNTSFLQNLLTRALENKTFPVKLEVEDITRIFEKGNLTITNLFSFKFQKCLKEWLKIESLVMLTNFYQDIFLVIAKKEYLKRANEKWIFSLDSKNYNGPGLMDLSKAFDTLKHNLLINLLRNFCSVTLQIDSKEQNLIVKLVVVLVPGVN